MLKLNNLLKKTSSFVSEENKLSYKSVPGTLELRKRCYEESQFKKYGLQKRKKIDIC